MAALAFARRAALLVLVVAMVMAACARSAPTPTATPIPIVKASLLVHLSERDERWFRDIAVPKGTNAYELTEAVVQGQLQAKWYPTYRAHFVTSILGIENKDPHYWLIYLWEEGEKQWQPLPVGADLFSVHDGHVLAWAYADTTVKGYHERLTTPLSPAQP